MTISAEGLNFSIYLKSYVYPFFGDVRNIYIGFLASAASGLQFTSVS